MLGAEGINTIVIGNVAQAEEYNSETRGASHAEGSPTQAIV
ncbi:hypothetical protein [Cytobacillus purgationiresistens]|uniref:Uncharacterized protein n=1 Tax=Cytobacillus purgationiresistens TaxID=863449 RepID=A0ABU0AEC4_9BACI|nr:hypothetical protein [Cytobacillus purgationiresistens]MDQ0269606.1 hypothetical protein [Cytobacillus purgationiresistens]